MVEHQLVYDENAALEKSTDKQPSLKWLVAMGQVIFSFSICKGSSGCIPIDNLF